MNSFYLLHLFCFGKLNTESWSATTGQVFEMVQFFLLLLFELILCFRRISGVEGLSWLAGMTHS